jgi:ketosteroid isomerase-like protein
MRNRIAALLPMLSVLFGDATGAQEGRDVAELTELEARLSTALVEQDAAALATLWHDDLIFITTTGRQFTKAERLAGLRGEPPAVPGQSNTNDAIAVQLQGDVAIVSVVSTWTTPRVQAPLISRYRALHVWTRERGQWELLAAQVAVIRD